MGGWTTLDDVDGISTTSVDPYPTPTAPDDMIGGWDPDDQDGSEDADETMPDFDDGGGSGESSNQKTIAAMVVAFTIAAGVIVRG